MHGRMIHYLYSRFVAWAIRLSADAAAHKSAQLARHYKKQQKWHRSEARLAARRGEFAVARQNRREHRDRLLAAVILIRGNPRRRFRKPVVQADAIGQTSLDLSC